MFDSSSFISLARAGLLGLLGTLPFSAVLLDVVRHETVDEGISGGHPDAAAIESAVALLPSRPTTPGLPADSAVLEAARQVGMLVTNDLTLGRRARNLGVAWMRTADLVLVAVRTGAVVAAEGRSAVVSLRDAGRLSADDADVYLGRMA